MCKQAIFVIKLTCIFTREVSQSHSNILDLLLLEPAYACRVVQIFSVLPNVYHFILFSGGPTSGSPRLHVEAQTASVQSPGSPISIQLALHRRGRPGSHLALATSTR